MHTLQLVAHEDGAMLKRCNTSAETLASMYGCAPGALDLVGFNGITIHGATTTCDTPVGITFTSENPTTGEFVPLQTLTRSCFQHQVHTDADMAHDSGQLCHYIANPASVGFVHPKVTMQLHESQCADNMATNLCLRQMRWPMMKMKPEEGYPTVHSEAHGEMAAIPLTAPATCNVSHLLLTNEEKIHDIAGKSAQIVESATAGKFAMIQTSALKSIEDKLEASFQTSSLFNGGLAINMFPLTGKPMKEGATTTLTYSLNKNPMSISERAANAIETAADTAAGMGVPSIERIHHAHIPAFLGEGDATAAAMIATVAPTQTELTAELAGLLKK